MAGRLHELVYTSVCLCVCVCVEHMQTDRETYRQTDRQYHASVNIRNRAPTVAVACQYSGPFATC